MKLNHCAVYVGFFLMLTIAAWSPFATAKVESTPWWQSAVVYQIYPRSFQDSNGDGVGDLHGIISRLDYLKDLGVDAVWISPFYPSPMKDFGYDISDYTDVDSRFGNRADFEALVAAMHQRGMKLILDFVPNHTSEEHPWFRQSRQSKTNPKRNWYMWRDGRTPDTPPNNWRSVFGGSAWKLDPLTGQYYYHAFLEAQPDLNWRNPEVRTAMDAVMRYWLDRGVDGFRVDAIVQLTEHPSLLDEPLNPNYQPTMADYERNLPVYTEDQPDTHQMVSGMRKLFDSYDGNRLLIAETYLPYNRLVAYYGSKDAPEAHLPFNFHLMNAPWNAAEVGKIVRDYEAALPPGAWPNWVLSNHDRSRVASRLPAGQERVAAMLLLTLRGTPTMYYGDELGMRDITVPTALSQDPFEKRDPGKGLGRDPERSPMQWDGTKGAGFSTGTSWLPLAPDYQTVNVATESADPKSLLSLYRALLALRHSEPALSTGSIQLVDGPSDCLSYERAAGESRFLVVINFSNHAVSVPLGARHGRVLMSSTMEPSDKPVAGTLALRANEGLMIALDGPAATAKVDGAPPSLR